MNLRNRLIWIAALTVVFAGVQVVASRRQAERELVEFVSDKLMPLAEECVRQANERSPHVHGVHGVLTLQLGLVPDGKLYAVMERVDVTASSELQDRELVACVRERARALTLKHPLPSGPQQIEVKLPIEPPAKPQ